MTDSLFPPPNTGLTPEERHPTPEHLRVCVKGPGDKVNQCQEVINRGLRNPSDRLRKIALNEKVR
jgi:hypothetical protein